MTLDILTAPAIAPVQHGFFTRKGGVSSGIYQGLNCGFGSADSAQNVRHNRDLVAKSFGIDRTHLISVHQTHSTQVTMVQGPITEPVQSDAMVTDQPGLALAILTADCQPVLFSDPVAGVIGAAHAGWRGTLDGILESTLDAMETLGAKRARIRAVIGPSISQGAYEVGPDFFDNFTMEHSDNARFFASGTNDRLQFDLIGFGLLKLRQAGVGHAEWTGHCTYSEPDRFYSYRQATHRKESDYGRLISVIKL
jgi:YfiH family protein